MGASILVQICSGHSEEEDCSFVLCLGGHDVGEPFQNMRDARDIVGPSRQPERLQLEVGRHYKITF